MSWLTPIGFLGFIGILILILIYILKPNYQQKMISTTFVWKLSLKYRKKKVPISKLRNIILFICQVLAITACALILAKPVIDSESVKDNEKIVIIDASATMLAQDGGETRFERAVMHVMEVAEKVARDNGLITVILADKKPEVIMSRVNGENISDLYARLDALVDPRDMKCSFGDADIDAAMLLAEDILVDNPRAEVILCTDTYYIDKGDVTVYDARGYEEWNVGIIDVKEEIIENKYSFTVSLISYGRDMDVDLTMKVNGFNGDIYSTQTFEASPLIRCTSGIVSKYTFDVTTAALISQYSDIHFFLGSDGRSWSDNFSYDDNYYLYGGKKPELRIQYASSVTNNFFSAFIDVAREQLASRWDIIPTTLKTTEIPETEGYDLYIFEGEKMPEEMPQDGIVWFMNPLSNIKDSGFTLSALDRGDFSVEMGESHPITTGLNFGNLQVSQYAVVDNSDGFTELAYINDDPVLLVKNDIEAKVALMTFSVNYSDISLMMEFPRLLLRMLDFFSPSTITRYVYEVDEEVTINSRLSTVELEGSELEMSFETFPAKVSISKPGPYTLKQTAFNGSPIIENFYVRIPAEQSNILCEEDLLTNPYIETKDYEDYLDLLVYFAAALVFLLFVEWWLQARELF